MLLSNFDLRVSTLVFGIELRLLFVYCASENYRIAGSNKEF